ncbi:MAG: tyrosine-type recombinase/integrase [Actinobacteria bacterium]|nr:tyrosine-type recombinase/integrase [Actinomycetota bacterium]
MADLAAEFALWLGEQGRAANTVASYRRDVAAYLRWCDVRPAGDVAARTLAAYVEHIRATKRPSSAARAVVALRIFHRWRDDDATKARPELAGLPVEAADQDHDLDEETVIRLIEATKGDTVERRRDAVCVALLYYSGLKASEAISLDLGDVAFDGKVITVDRDGPHERVLPAVPVLQRALTRWLEPSGRARLRPGTDAVLVNRRGKRLTRQGLWLVTGAVADRAGIGDSLSPNALRRACAAHLADRHVAPAAIAAFLGHTQRRAPGAAILNEAGWGGCNLVV